MIKTIMEKQMAILLADLSGYTALTEVHGAATAANTIDKYMDIVQVSLMRNCTLHERIGDEVMIVSDSPDDLLETALMLIHNCSKENHFLQIHGGLHYGKILKHKDHYFGSPVNITSRIAGKAGTGAFWCSTSFVQALSTPSGYAFTSKGNYDFKNVTGNIEVFEINLDNPGTFYVDPVCRMIIHHRENAFPHPRNKDLFFCSSQCLNHYSKTH